MNQPASPSQSWHAAVDVSCTLIYAVRRLRPSQQRDLPPPDPHCPLAGAHPIGLPRPIQGLTFISRPLSSRPRFPTKQLFRLPPNYTLAARSTWHPYKVGRSKMSSRWLTVQMLLALSLKKDKMNAWANKSASASLIGNRLEWLSFLPSSITSPSS